MSPSTLDLHLASCADCARWERDAVRLTRMVRLDVRPVPDLSEEIVAQIALPVRQVLRRRFVLRVLLLLSGLAQLAIGIPAVVGDSLGMAMAMHAAHEAAAWNIAIGIAFLAAALTPRRAAGLVPLLATFLVVLGALSVHDVASGVVSGGRLATHIAALVGLLILLALDRAERALPPTRFSARSGRDSDDGNAGGSGLRTVA